MKRSVATTAKSPKTNGQLCKCQDVSVKMLINNVILFGRGKCRPMAARWDEVLLLGKANTHGQGIDENAKTKVQLSR